MKVAVIDCGYGDSGKGLVTSWLAKELDSFTPIVVRFSGGSQCGHGVRPDSNSSNIFHEFQTIGSGSFNGNPTYLTEDVIVDPISLYKEIQVLNETLSKRNGSKCPEIIVHPNCPIITPCEVVKNLDSKEIMSHGSCGRGILTTKLREAAHYHLTMGDLLYPSVLKQKVELLAKYYGFEHTEEIFAIFFEACKKLLKEKNFSICGFESSYTNCNCIFEGSQGLMLDEHIGYYPHCTPTNVKIPTKYGQLDTVYLVTRAYHSRHGNGPLSTEEYSVPDNKWETNYLNNTQGKFKKGILDLDVLSYSISKCDFSNVITTNLVITHLDIVEGQWKLLHKGEIKKFGNEQNFIQYIVGVIPKYVSRVYISKSPFTDKIIKWDKPTWR